MLTLTLDDGSALDIVSRIEQPGMPGGAGWLVDSEGTRHYYRWHGFSPVRVFSPYEGPHGTLTGMSGKFVGTIDFADLHAVPSAD